MKLPKDLTKVLQPYLDSGWLLTEGSRHYKIRSPTGALVTISHSASCPYYLKHVVGDLKRAGRVGG